jgi:hypothetical protein
MQRSTQFNKPIDWPGCVGPSEARAERVLITHVTAVEPLLQRHR